MDRTPPRTSPVPQHNISYPAENANADPSPADAAASSLPPHLLGVANVSPQQAQHAASGGRAGVSLVEYSRAAVSLRAPRRLATTPSELQTLIDENHAMEPGEWDRRTLRHQGRSLFATISTVSEADGIWFDEEVIEALQASLDRIADDGAGVHAPTAVLWQQTEALRERFIDCGEMLLRISFAPLEQGQADGADSVFDASLVFNADPLNGLTAHEVRLFRLARSADQSMAALLAEAPAMASAELPHAAISAEADMAMQEAIDALAMLTTR